MPSHAVIDPEAIDNLRELNPGDNDAFLHEIIGIFLEDTPRRIAELEQSLAAREQAKFIRAAHSIKGSSSNLGAVALRDVAEQLEHRSKNDGLGEVAGLLDSLKSEFAHAQAALTALLGQRSA